jgi:hypothetical protein
MKKWTMPVICAICAVFLVSKSFSGHQEVVYTSIGKTYNKFLFFPAKSAHFTISFRNPYTGQLTLIDDKGSALRSDKYTIAVDGKNTGSSFTIKAKSRVNVSIKCSNTVSPGKHYVQVKGGGPLVTHVYFKHHLNPLFVWLSWIMTAWAVIIIIWFIVLKKMFYPQFKNCQKTFLIPNQAPLIVKLTGARMVIISSENKKQGFWNALIKGPVLYKQHPYFTSPITMRPVKGGNILVRTSGGIYKVAPNPIPRIGRATIENTRSNVQITIN